ncbi:hypothetical protein ACOKM5_42980 [Streptomyces sp. BH097]|uniref:hypothetical protein n=1 Tax=unclassified Streptomyces TaxID=2593676 RepID=UPI003BB6B5D6
MTAHPELTRQQQLLEAAEPIFRTLTDHAYDRALSYEVLDVLSPLIDDTDAYGETLAAFADRFHKRLERNLADYGPTTVHYLKHGRYRLASQPEGLIVFERLSNARFTLKSAWDNSELPEALLTDMGQIWGVGL